ncbi:unnamed protein product [Acanthoscelides obtectus]|uniref:MD-2-related lipid-recognition domain-containing protein n=1 Tax=Acanthoscelides obtectus TaxID=200917 RepID=A0A9P0LX82_ACAOB|nr:unnamed protein product [Acanthoscelides obtectus]CAK1666958.1 NPC intracellular cholesterol transporter 2 homolog a [Acanthoscelides obtectus]
MWSRVSWLNRMRKKGSEVGTISDVEVSDCVEGKRCILKRNTNVTLKIIFTPKGDSDTLKAVVHGEILGVPMPFDLPNPDGCKDSGVTCPLKAGQTYTYINALPISPHYPRVTVDVKWELQLSNDEDAACAKIPAKIA